MADAPRFRAFWEHFEGRSVLTMSRTQWGALAATTAGPVEIDVARTPVAGVTRRASVVQALVEQGSSATAQVTITRYDPKDAPTPYNVDRYWVWVDVLSHHSLQQMISASSSELNENFRQFAAENVFLIKQDPGPDHWLPTLPGSATTIVRST